MADEDYGDDGFYFGDDDYLYVEDAFAIADELAENQIPSPGYAGTNNELEYETYEYDIYEYFGELEYADDTYWDSTITHLGGTAQPTPSKAGEKRKRGAAVAQTAKRRKGPGAQEGAGEVKGKENVIYKSFKQRLPPTPPALEKRTSFALLPDWQERFRDEGKAVVAERDMPPDMRRAAEAKDEEGTPVKRGKRQAGEMVEDEEEGDEWEDEDEEGDEEDDGGVLDALGGLDADTLKAILKQKLSETGMNIEGEALDKMIAQLLSGSADDAAGNLANLLLGQAQESEDSTASKWLSQQGVQFDDQDGNDEATTPASSHAGPQISPSDSAVGIDASAQNKTVAPAPRTEQTQATNRAATTTNSQQGSTLTTRKRKASFPEAEAEAQDQNQPSSKRRQPSHALPLPPPEPTTTEAPARRTRRAVSTRHSN